MQKYEKDQGIADVKAQVHEMDCAGFVAEQAGIDHVRNPGQRVPIAFISYAREGPDHGIPRQSGDDMRVLEYLSGIVVINEVGRADAPKRDKGQERESRADQEITTHIRHDLECAMSTQALVLWESIRPRQSREKRGETGYLFLNFARRGCPQASG